MVDQEFLYFTDPMCSWCYGIGSEVEKVQDEYAAEIPLSVIAGGLRPDEKKVMPDRLRSEVSHHWEQVNEASGKPFDFKFFENHPHFVYNTSPACKAVVVAKTMDVHKALEYQTALQTLFYANGEDPLSIDTFVKAAEQVGLDAADFREMYESAEAETLLRKNFILSREFGVSSYPTLCIRIRDKYVLVTQGYMKYEDLKQRIDYALEKYNTPVPSEN